MKQLSLWALLFAILSLVFFILLVFLRVPFPLYPLASYQDALDLLTPLILIPLYWVLFRYAAREMPGTAATVVFLILAVFWVEGQGMHLSANSISNLMERISNSELIALQGNDAFRLTHFYDEYLGHYLWHIGVFGLAGLLVIREWLSPSGATTNWLATIPAGVIYGFTLFAITIEGHTLWMGLLFSILLTLFGVLWGRKRLGRQPVLAFIFAACLVAALLYTGWGLYWGGFPDFGQAGII